MARGTRRSADGRVRHTPTGPAPRPRAPASGERLSALPSPLARALAFVAILVGGACGGLIGYGVVKVSSTDGASSVASGIGALLGASIVAGGVAVLAVLTLRAMGEWRHGSLADVDRDTHLGGLDD